MILSSCSQPAPPAKSTAAPAPEKVVYTEVDPATAGVIAGKVLFSGKKPVAKKVNMEEDQQCSKLHKSAVYDEAVIVGSGGGLANAFVYLKSGLEGKKFRVPAEPVTIDQRGCWFEPRVFGIQAGQTFSIVNSDPVTHNIHPRAQNNREWNQSQDPGSPALSRKFVRPEVMIRVKCNVHPWMKAWVGVVDSPYYAVTDRSGAFEMKNVPPGDYTLEVWHEELGIKQEPVKVAASSKVETSFSY
jgi:plastocyanin